MNDERVVEEVITKFILNTCRLRPQFSQPAVMAAMTCAYWESPLDEPEADLIPLVTGSVAEFYIEPMLPHVGDIDVMLYRNTGLAIPEGYLPPTQLPSEFHNCVEVYEIVDSQLPGYVFLQPRHLLIECIDEVSTTP